MSPLRGDAAFRYDVGAGTVTVALNWPLFRIRPGSVRWRRTTWSLSRRVAETLTIGSSTPEILATVRFHTDPLELLTMLEAGADGYTLNYLPSLAAGTSYPFLLVEPTGEVLQLLRDQSARGKLGEYELELRLRRVDGGSVAGLFP